VPVAEVPSPKVTVYRNGMAVDPAMLEVKVSCWPVVPIPLSTVTINAVGSAGAGGGG
jgi:hypothetical protein